MELFVTNKQPAPSTKEVCTRHNGVELFWKINSRVPNEQFDIFREINAYWQTLVPSEQDRIFELYQKAYMLFTVVTDTERLFEALRPIVKELFDYHPQERIDYWVRFKSNLLIPADIPRKFDSSLGSRMTVEKTYTEEDYRKLLALAVSVRIMVPIWGEFLKRTEKETDPLRKEYLAYKLLVGSNVMKCEAHERLLLYIRHTVLVNKSIKSTAKALFNTTTMLGCLGTEDYPEWVLADIVVLRLIRYDLSGVGDNAIIITHIHNYIGEHIGMIESRFGRVKDKKPDDQTAGETNHSRLERFRVKELVAAGDIVANSTYIRMATQQVFGRRKTTPLSLINRLYRTIDNPKALADRKFFELTAQSIRCLKPLINEQLKDCQIILTGWVLAPVISPRVIPYLKKQNLIEMIGFAQAYLWHNNHRELAALIGARAIDDLNDGARVLADQKEKLNKQQLQELTQKFPFMRRSTSYRNARGLSMVFSALEIVATEFGDYDWQIVLPDSWLTDWPAVNRGGIIDRRLRNFSDLLPKLAALILELEQREESGIMRENVGLGNSLA